MNVYATSYLGAQTPEIIALEYDRWYEDIICLHTSIANSIVQNVQFSRKD